jgi:hypothetical protein
MKRPPDDLHLARNALLPRHDYQAALQNAVSWLGDRYLLAEPVSRRREELRPFFAEQRRWHESVSASAR